MPIGEFDLIAQYFAGLTPDRDDIRLGIGDDAAVVSVPPGQELVIAVDTLVAGVHFPAGTDPRAIGHKALAVNLSDLAAMGAEPAWALLALTLPEADEAWLAAFAAGFGRLARDSEIALIGGDTTRGPLSVTVTVHGRVPEGQALTRSGARPGDAIYISGGLGAAAAALASSDSPADSEARQACRARLDYPEPRLALGQALCGLASAAIDISDGLLADLGHLCRSSSAGAEIDVDAVPRHPALTQLVTGDDVAWYDWPLAGGDDYELCFTVSGEKEPKINMLTETLGIALTRIGRITAGEGLVLQHADGGGYQAHGKGYQHFAPQS
ncbi:thiamine-monophosphate kinase [Thiohalobacter thiocyanaticus]|uniref:Thiamine-monophosphate kinase n=1 Tax=Thiohalobacter thiocyanaticus TaxID=585455 RepID=A0A1Z4VPP8_9GAMM|nr:thiamine-phosphate kinase [Thiohalobacter thiocyanaticus]BAZ93587.1 thiamine-monophosphate kinase [Thiohalobacter thiocyanaticus]